MKIAKRHCRIVLFGLMLAWLSGCAVKQFMQTYDGEALPLSQSALLKPTAGVVIKSIDGKPLGSASSDEFTPVRLGFPNIDAEISFKPGVHTLVLGYFVRTSTQTTIGTIKSVDYTTVRFNAVAGRKYLLRGDRDTADTAWKPVIIDVTDKPEVWSYECDGRPINFWRKGC